MRSETFIPLLGGLAGFLLGWGGAQLLAPHLPASLPARWFAPLRRLGASFRSRLAEARERRAFAAALPAALEILRQSLRSGRTLLQSLETLSREGPPPVAGDAARVVREVALGADLEAALGGWAARRSGGNLDRLVAAVRLSRRTGCDLGRLVSSVREGLERRRRLVLRRDALTAQARLSAQFMAALPFLLAAGTLAVDPGFLDPLWRTRVGWAVLGAALFLELFGALWLRRLLEEVR